jgi:type I restriction enzyme S subunit
MANLQPYKKYNSVAYDYATELPDGWQLWKIAHAFNLIGSGTTPQSGNISFYESGTINWINTGDLNDGVINECKNKITELAFKKHSVLKIYPKGTLLVAMYGATIGKAAVMNLEGCTNQACCALSKSKILTNKFTLYWFIANRKNIVNLSYGGGQPNISQDVIKKLKIPVPPLEVQNSIVAYLDKKNSEIDKFIRNKERLVELAIENKDKKIWEIITGKNIRKVEFKESSIECMGKIPMEWNVKNLNYISNVVLGKMLCNENKGNYKLKPYLKSKNIGWENVIVDEVDEMWYSKNEMKTYRIHKDDLLVSEGGEVGKTCIWNEELEECYIQNSVHKITLKKKFNPVYYLYYFYLLGKNSYFKSIVNQVSIGHLTREKLVKVKCIIPPFEVQEKLVQEILKELDFANTIISKAQKEISSIKEYREALITDLVTGKRSVPQL